MRNRIVSPFTCAQFVVLSAALLALSVTARATNKGPDVGGYSGTDETVYSLVDASQGGAGVLTGSDDGTAALTLPFTFQFYGHPYSMVCVSSNGAVYFIADLAECGAIADFANTDLSNTAPPGDKPGLFPFWTDLTFDQPGAGSVLYKTEGAAGNRQFVVQWNNAFPLGSANPVTFEAILYETSNQIRFQYKTLGGAGNGGAATVGIRDAGSLVSGKQIPWSSNAPVVADNSAILFGGSRPEPGVKVTGGSFTYNASPRTGSGFAYGAGDIGDVLAPPVTLTYAGTAGTSYGPTTIAPTNVGSYTVTANFIGNATYGTGSASDSLTIGPATLTYLATAASRPYGAVNPPLTGTVTGFAGTDNQVSATTGTLSFASPALPTTDVGRYAINGSGLTAINGNYTFAQAAANGTALTITKATQTITFVSAPPPTPTVGGTYLVSADGGPSGNPVVFSSVPTTVCTAAGNVVSFVAAGGCQIAANQSGNQNYSAAPQVTQSMTVASAPALTATTTTIASSSNPSMVGQSVTFTATVKQTGSTIVATGGTMTFKEGATVLAGPTPLNASGQASFTALGLAASSSTNPVLTAGTHTISAVYSGTAIYAASAGSISQVVVKIPTTTVVVSSKNPSNSNQTVTFTATVKSNGQAVTTGKVIFKDGPTTLGGPIAVSGNGTVSLSISNLSQGDHTISAIYGPTDTHDTSTGTVTQSVKK